MERNDMGDKVGVIAVASASSGKQVLHRKPKENGYKKDSIKVLHATQYNQHTRKTSFVRGGRKD